MESPPNERQEIDPEDLPPGCPPGFPYIPTSDPNVLLFEVNDAHWYWHIPERVWMKSVTKITGVYPKGYGFHKWLASRGSIEAADQEKTAGGDRGTAVHSGITSLSRGDTIKRTEFTPEAWSHLVPFVNWVRNECIQILANEIVVYDVRRRIAGTMDMIVGKIERLGIVDEKTASHIYRSAEHQSNEYAWILNHMTQESRQNIIDIIERNSGIVLTQEELRAEFAAVLRTNSKHRVGYEYKEWDVSDRMHKTFVSMHFLEHDSDPTMEPTFPPPVPHELSLEPLREEEPSRNGKPVKTELF